MRFRRRPGGLAAPIYFGFDYGTLSASTTTRVFSLEQLRHHPGGSSPRHRRARDLHRIDGPRRLRLFRRQQLLPAPYVAATAALCIDRGRGSGGPKQVMHKLLHQAQTYNLAHPAYGFLGDPLSPIGPQYYGYLIRAGLY